MPSVRFIRVLYQVIYSAIALVFAVGSVALLVLACRHLLRAALPGTDLGADERFQGVLETIGILTIAVASLELSQTVVEEEVLRDTQMSAPTRARRFLSRFMVVIVVASGVEFLVAVFELLHGDSARLPHAAAIGIATAALLAAWGAFVKWNRAAEELEPDALHKAKAEDQKIEAEK